MSKLIMKFSPVFPSTLIVTLFSAVSLTAEPFKVTAIPELDPKGDVYKTEGPNDPLIYENAIGTKKMIMVYCDFSDAAMEVDTREHGKKCLGDKTFETIFKEQSYGKLDFEIEQIHGWKRMPGVSKDYDTSKTETHRDMFVQVFKLYPEVDFLKYDYICAVMPRVGNTAFGEREEIAIPYRDKKIKVAMNLSSANPYTFAHEVGHLMGLPDIYTYEGVKGPQHPAGPWDLMSISNACTGFFGWHRHKLAWLDADRKTYLTSDNGYFHGEHGLADKWYPHQESIRVPLIIRDPRMDAAKRGTTNDEFTVNADLAPTILRFAGFEPPKVMQGRDISELYLGKEVTDWRKEFFYEHPKQKKKDFIPASEALVRKDWKYFYWPEHEYEQLFHIAEDPFEQTDLAKDPKHAEKLAEMRKRFNELKEAAK